MVYQTSYPWNIEPSTHGNLDTPTHGIWIPLPMVFVPPTNRISNYPWHPPIYSMLTPYPWYIDPYPWYIEPLSMVFRHLYPWYLDTPTHGILTPYQ